MKLNSKSGATLAAAAATLFLAGATVSNVAQAQGAAGHCVGANACKGQGACKGGANACKGQNAWKGQGFTSLTKEKCDAVKGKWEKS